MSPAFCKVDSYMHCMARGAWGWLHRALGSGQGATATVTQQHAVTVSRFFGVLCGDARTHLTMYLCHMHVQGYSNYLVMNISHQLVFMDYQNLHILSFPINKPEQYTTKL